MFEPLGGVPTRVRQRRLPAMRRALAQWSDTRSIRAVARASGSHAKGSFQEAFGVTPGEFRPSVPVAGPGPMRGGRPRKRAPSAGSRRSAEPARARRARVLG